ncbi:hypothetical protein [Gimesia algae]|uniref:Uncharacterized protein n=1 Tax=Gimesia algae TaxID=2527971 RepID=A0A517V666_9PLAN|nr:hypothetical protein [Gimesia algae]QDT88498.1 hypothetical protein Pan161_01140 [Gimesia algae]
MPVRIILICPLMLCLFSSVAEAGMPGASIDLTEIAQLRLQSISFFLLLFLLSAWGLKKLWNMLARDFPKLPVITFKAALAGTFLWGLMFLFVLTMISGARELLTPGAWEKDGRTYRLTDSESEQETKAAAAALLKERRSKLAELRSALFMHVATHDGSYPAKIEDASFADEFWMQPGDVNVKYGYVPGEKKSDEVRPLAFEQAVYGDEQQLILFTDGAIKQVSLTAARETLNEK